MCREISHRFWSIRALEALEVLFIGIVYSNLCQFWSILPLWRTKTCVSCRVYYYGKGKTLSGKQATNRIPLQMTRGRICIPDTGHYRGGVSHLETNNTQFNFTEQIMCSSHLRCNSQYHIWICSPTSHTYETIINCRAHTHYLSPWISPFTGKSQQ